LTFARVYEVWQVTELITLMSVSYRSVIIIYEIIVICSMTSDLLGFTQPSSGVRSFRMYYHTLQDAQEREFGLQGVNNFLRFILRLSSHTVWCRLIGWLMSNLLGTAWNGAIMAWLKYFPGISLEGLRKTRKTSVLWPIPRPRFERSTCRTEVRSVSLFDISDIDFGGGGGGGGSCLKLGLTVQVFLCQIVVKSEFLWLH
jgi:hypothetical protein